MKIIISPAKKMVEDTDSIPWKDFPHFLSMTDMLRQQLQGMSKDELQQLWKCNDKIAGLNVERLKTMDLTKNLTPAILAYEGIQYQNMAPAVFTNEQYSYIQEHLRILSGFYGILRPLDGIVSYRLEMQAKLQMQNTKDLYSFWGDMIAQHLFRETSEILNLASKEYSTCISKYLTPDIRFVSCVFGEENNGKIIEKGTMCKMARGKMVRYLAEENITTLEKVKDFRELNYCYSEEHSTENTFVFLKQSSR